MKKFWNRIKYELLWWLLDDLCDKSKCGDCAMERPAEGKLFYPCVENEVFVQARKVWGLTNEEVYR